MKRIALIFALISLVVAACSPAPAPEPEPLSGVVDFAGFAGTYDAELGFICGDENSFSTTYIEIYGATGSIDLDLYRPECTTPLFFGGAGIPEELLVTGIGKITGSMLVGFYLETSDDSYPIWPVAPAGAERPFVFYANESGTLKGSGSFADSGMASLVADTVVNWSIDTSYSRGWNAATATFEFVGLDEVNVEFFIVPLHTLEWDEDFGPH